MRDKSSLSPSTTQDYEAFLATKAQIGGEHGFAADWIPDALFPFQRALVEWSIRKGRAAILADCGLGKSLMELVWAHNVHRHTGKPVLILTPLAVAQQFIREGEKFGIEVDRSVAGEIDASVIVTNYERLHLFRPEQFGGVVCDECFPAGTEIDTPTGRTHIENVTIGDKILNASGIDTVSDVHRREVPYAIRITVNGEPIVSSPNHPYFTRTGWKGAMDLIAGDEVLATAAAMRMVRKDLHSQVRASCEDEILRTILLSEMADGPTRAQGEGTHAGGREEARREAESLVGVGIAGSTSGNRTHSEPQSDARSRSAGESLPHIESDPPQTFRAWGQRAWFDEASADHAGCTWTELGSGMAFVTGPIDSRLSDGLQARLGRSRDENQHRGGWSIPPQPEGGGPEARRDDRFSRVDRLEVLEQGHPDLERFRDADGKLYFYDLGGTRHPSFSIHGLLVHNSSILKSFDGVRKAEITEFLRTLPYRLLGTATAAPNDYTELGTSSESLGELGYMDMLSRFFTNTQNTSKARRQWAGAEWRFKGHAEQGFWRWVASWARAMRRPSDLGFDDAGFDLPPLHVNEHVVKARKPAPGMLFDMPAANFFEEREERNRTIQERCEAAAALVADTGEPAVVWCHLNAEGDLLEKLIPGSRQVAGKHGDDEKEETFAAFASGDLRVLITKPKIGALGLNWQHANHMTFFPSHSYEQYYQAVRRMWRFGQQRPVTVDIIETEGEARIQKNLQRKTAQADAMFSELVAHMRHELTIARADTYNIPVEVPTWLAS